MTSHTVSSTHDITGLGAKTSVDHRAASTVAADLFNDATMTARIKGQFMSKDRFDDTDISVSTQQGRVTLDGSVATVAQREWAENTCLAVEGVTSVHNALNVVPIARGEGSSHSAPNHPGKTECMASDTWLTTKVKAELLADSVTKSFQIHVKTFHGVVSLHGELGSPKAIKHVTELVTAMDDVKHVDASGLKVKRVAF
jgi:hyperosmotically inducible protein